MSISFARYAASHRRARAQSIPEAVDLLDMGDNPNDISLVIIDDNAGSLELLSAALENEGIRIFTAQDPEEGVEIVFREHPQIVLTDLVMPGLSGLDVLDRVVEFDPAIDVVLMTAHYTTESAVEAIRKGASDYLNKPVSIPLLRERIAKLADEARRRERARRSTIAFCRTRSSKEWSDAVLRCGRCSRAFAA